MKIDRLLAMTILLLNRGRISAKELAERFEVSTKTIYRDMDALCQAGIPVAAYQGTSGGFELMEQFTISRQYLTIQEINAIVAAVKGMGTVLDDAALEQLLDKVKATLGRENSAGVAGADAGVVIDLNPWGHGLAMREKVKALKKAIEERLKVEIHYLRRDGEESERAIEPLSLILKTNIWYLYAYCCSRQDYRVFRLSRIARIDWTAERFISREAPSLEQYQWDPDWYGERKVTASMLFHPSVRYRLGDSGFPPSMMTEIPGKGIMVRGEFVVDEWFYGMLLSYGEHVRVEEPAFIAHEIVRRAGNMIAQYSK